MRCVDYIKDEKTKIQRFLGGLSTYYRDKFQFDKPKNIEAAIRKIKYLYEQSKGRSNLQRSLRDEKKRNKIKGRKALDLLSLEATPTLLSQIKHLKVDQRQLNHWRKYQGNQLNVGDMDKTIWLKITHIKEVEQ